MWFRSLFRVKSIAQILASRDASPNALRRTLGPVDLTLLGVGAIVGAGIFALIGSGVAGDSLRPGAGPALVVSLALTGVACALTALCYAELAALVPVSGSAYTYAYASLGEMVAWIIGWNLILEYAVGNIAVAVSWSGYFCGLLQGWGIEFPRYLATDLRTALSTPEILDHAPRLFGIPLVANLPAVGIVAVVTIVLVIGIRESAWFNAAMAAVKLAVLGLFIAVGLFYVQPENWRPFAPSGWRGIQAGSALMFFAFIGFDAVSTTAEECRRPHRDLPIGILGSLVVCTVLYIAVAAVLTGMIPWDQLDTVAPLSTAMRMARMDWAAGVIALGSLVAHTGVLLVFQLGQPRVLMAMSRDGLLPGVFARVDPRRRTPAFATWATGVFVAVGAALASLEEMADMCSIGTMSAFLLVCVGIPVLRRRDPHRERPFRTPCAPLVPALGALACLWLLAGLPALAWQRFAVWLAVGVGCYLAYGRRHSRLASIQDDR